MLTKYKNLDLALLIARLGLSVLFFNEGITKILSFGQTSKFFASIGLSVDMLYFIIAVELLAAVVFLIGILPEWGYVIAIEMLVIIFKLQLPHGIGHIFGFEFTVFALALAVALAGPGKYSLTRWFAGRSKS